MMTAILIVGKFLTNWFLLNYAQYYIMSTMHVFIHTGNAVLNCTGIYLFYRNTSLSEEEFVRDYLSIKKPVILSGFLMNWPAVENWRRSRFTERYGSAHPLCLCICLPARVKKLYLVYTSSSNLLFPSSASIFVWYIL